MPDFNKVMLMGRLTRDPELRYTPSGMAVVKIGLAVGRRYFNKNTNETVEETTFVDCDAWGKQAETLNQYMRKGRPLFIEGRLKLDSWETREGQKRSKLSVVIDNFQFIDSGGAGGAAGGGDSGQGRSEGRSGSDQDRSGSDRGRSEQGSPQVQAGNVADAGSSGPSSGSSSESGAGKGGGGQEYDFEDIPF